MSESGITRLYIKSSRFKILICYTSTQIFWHFDTLRKLVFLLKTGWNWFDFVMRSILSGSKIYILLYPQSVMWGKAVIWLSYWSYSSGSIVSYSLYNPMQRICDVGIAGPVACSWIKLWRPDSLVRQLLDTHSVDISNIKYIINALLLLINSELLTHFFSEVSFLMILLNELCVCVWVISLKS